MYFCRKRQYYFSRFKKTKMTRNIFWFPRWLIKRPAYWFIFWLVFIPGVFFVDKYSNPQLQVLPAAIVCYMLAGALIDRGRRDRVLLTVLVVVATLFEVLASLILHWYTYRFHNLPYWIPPGHGIVFLTAILAAEQNWAIKHKALLRWLVTLAALGYGLFGVMMPRHDLAGALFGGVFLVWLWATSSTKSRFYTMLWVCVCYLELAGVFLGAWHWSRYMPLTGLSEANPPSGIVGAYGAFDLIAFAVTAALLRVNTKRAKLFRLPVVNYGRLLITRIIN
jgi:hypothetical protein